MKAEGSDNRQEEPNRIRGDSKDILLSLYPFV